MTEVKVTPVQENILKFANKLQETLKMPDEDFKVRKFDGEANAIHMMFTYYGLSIHISVYYLEITDAYNVITYFRDWGKDYDFPVYETFNHELTDEHVQIIIDKIKKFIEPEEVIERLFPPYIKRTIAYISLLADNYF